MEKRYYQEAVIVQDACNLCGVVQSFAKILPVIMDESRAKGLGTDWVNQHPISKLFASKITSLSNAYNANELMVAFDICGAVAKFGEQK